MITVAILNYRRREALIHTLKSVLDQTYVPREIIVVDNGSGDDTPRFLEKNYPEVRVVAVPENLGGVGRNRGVQAACGDLVVTLDNDVYFDSPFELQKIVNAFAECPFASCIVFKVLEASTGRLHVRDWCHPRHYAEYGDTDFETPFIAEGACAFRREEFMKVGGYYEPLWIGNEGWDLALRLMDVGGRIFYKPAIRVRHLISSETRASWRPYYYYTRNYLWITARNYGLANGAWFLAGKLAMMAYFAVRTRNMPAFARGLRDGLRTLPQIWKTRRAISPATCSLLKELTRERPSLVARYRRHRQRPLI